MEAEGYRHASARYALAVATFVIGLTEIIVVGLLARIAAYFAALNPTAGHSHRQFALAAPVVYVEPDASPIRAAIGLISSRSALPAVGDAAAHLRGVHPSRTMYNYCRPRRRWMRAPRVSVLAPSGCCASVVDGAERLSMLRNLLSKAARHCYLVLLT